MNGRRTRKRKLHGGELLGKGSFGCGFFPGFRCSDTGIRDDTIMTKLMFKEFAEEELNKAESIKKVDPQMNYSIYPYKLCYPNLTNVNTYMNEGFSNCDFLDRKFNNPEHVKYWIDKNDLVFLQSKYGGQSLQTIIIQEFARPSTSNGFIYSIFKKFANVLRGVETYHKHNFVHFDIKEGNIVCDKQSCRMIDFGISQSLNKYIPGDYEFDQKYPFILDSLYVIWPLDAYFIKNWDGLFRNGEPNLLDKYVDKFYKILKALPIVPPELYMGEELDESFIPFNTMDDVYLFYENLLNYMLVFNKSHGGDLKTVTKQLREFIFKQLDVYSTGMQILYLTYNLTLKRMKYDKIEPVKTSKSPSNVPDEIVHALYRLAMEMMNLNPFKRLTMKEALPKYEAILNKMTLTKSSIKRQTRKK